MDEKDLAVFMQKVDKDDDTEVHLNLFLIGESIKNSFRNSVTIPNSFKKWSIIDTDYSSVKKLSGKIAVSKMIEVHTLVQYLSNNKIPFCGSIFSYGYESSFANIEMAFDGQSSLIFLTPSATKEKVKKFMELKNTLRFMCKLMRK